MKRSYVIAGLLALATVAWLGSGQLDDGKEPLTSRKPPVDLTRTETVPAVRVRDQTAMPRVSEVLLRGQTEAFRKVEVKAETAGRVVELPLAEGARVAQGQVIARLSPDERPAALAEAKALLEQRRIEYEAARRLSEKGFRAETQLAASKAALEAAAAAVAQAEVAIDNLTIRAPFDGILSERVAEQGDYLDRADPVARVVDLDPVLAVADISERDVARVALGRDAQVRLITGDLVPGTVRYIAREADPVTRTFRIEVELANPDAAVPDGATAEIRIPLETVLAHRVSPAILTLTDEGQIGVKILGPDNTVAFRPVKILSDDAEGVWIGGLPERVTLITVGQEFVTEGQTVRPIDERSLTPVARSGES